MKSEYGEECEYEDNSEFLRKALLLVYIFIMLGVLAVFLKLLTELI